MGYKYKNAEFNFTVFDRFTVDQGYEQIGLTEEMCEKWAERRSNESQNTRYRRIVDVRALSCFLNEIGIESYIPRTVKYDKYSFVPYIFTHDEIVSFFNACDTTATPKKNDRGIFKYEAPSLFRVLYGCGLRLSEALELEFSDVNLKEGYFVIRNTKNGTDRMVPFSDSVRNVLTQYMEYRNATFGEERYFFAKPGNPHWCTYTVYEKFRAYLFRAGISYRGKGKGPRVHDFRHTFSVHSLAAMSKQGLDLYYSLPILSKYLGHASLEATDKYVRLTAEMYPDVMVKINKLCASIFPEVSIDNEE